MSSPTLQLEYDVRSLPTEQHRAGLGGLLFLLNSLPKTHPEAELCFEVDDLTLRLELSLPALAALLGRLYAATKTIRNDKLEQRPAGLWLKAVGCSDQDLAFWQDSVWFTLRDRAASRRVYDDAGQKVAGDLWKALTRAREGKSSALPLSGALYLTGRASSNEDVPFDGHPHHVLLLHFAHALALPLPMFGLDSQGKSVGRGTAWVMITPRRLLPFPAEMTRWLSSRPSGLRVTLAEEAGLSALHRLDPEVVSGAFCVGASKQGHNLEITSASYLCPTSDQLALYREVAAVIGHYDLRKTVLLNLLKGRPLSRGVGKMLASFPSEQGVAEGDAGGYLAVDAEHLLRHCQGPETRLLLDFVRSTIARRAAERTPKLDYQGFLGGSGYPELRDRFRRSWYSAAHLLSYRLRRARSETLLAAVLSDLPPPMDWRGRRDLALLCLAAASNPYSTLKESSV